MTDLGDLALLAPLTLAILLWLLVLRAPRAAAQWGAAVGFCVGLTGLLKIFFYGCPPAFDVRSPSGHTSLSTLVYGAMALVTALESGGVRRLLAMGGGAGLIFAIAASRLLLDAHSIPEVGLGLVIGTAALALSGRGYLRRRPEIVRLSPLLVSAVVLVFVFHGSELRAEEFLHRITGYLRIHCI